jgi:hypothetical protein
MAVMHTIETKDSVKDFWTGGQKLKDEIESKLNILNKYAAQ